MPIGKFVTSLLMAITVATPAHAGTVTYRIAPGPAQNVRFDARTNTEKYAGHTDQISGEVRVDPEQITAKPVAYFTVRVGSLSTGNGTRDSNMRRQHLFVDAFPTASLVLSTLDLPAPGRALNLSDGKPVTGTLHGLLTLHGVTKTVVPTVTVTRERDAPTGRDSLHIVAHFVVRLEDYAIPTPRFLFFATKQEHAITVDVHAIAVP